MATWLSGLVIAVTAPEPRRGVTRLATAPAVTMPPAATMPQTTTPTAIVHFRGRGPLARAERVCSARRVVAELSRQLALRGLCFVAFEPRGLVLRRCDGGALERWPQRLRAMGAVARVEAGE